VPNFTESIVEDAALSWFAELQYSVLHGPEITLLPKLLSGELRVNFETEEPKYD
jgi:hypothetical protein